MSKRRKPRGPLVSASEVKRVKADIKDREILRLAYRMEILEGLRKDGVLNMSFIALEALGALSGALLSGRTEAELQTTWPKEWGTEAITLPLALILALRDGWEGYRQAPTGRSLGEALRIEGGGQGSSLMKAKLATIDRARGLARQIESKYVEIEGDPNPMRLDDAIHEVALAHNVSFKTAKEAHKAHRNDIRDGLTDLELLKGVKPSRS
jgi:hypothetical protein